MDWNAWIPAIISAATALVIIGGYLMKIKDHDKRLDDHDKLHKETEDHDNLQDVALAKLEAWRDGYNAAKATIVQAIKN